MNSADPFEERLGRVPFRQAPSSLRAQALQAAREAAPSRSEQQAPSRRWWMAPWVWPHPVAWATLGLAWLVVLSLHLAAMDRPDVAPQQPRKSLASPALVAALREQRAMLHSLLEDPPAAALPAVPGPGAQLWRRENCSQSILA